MTSRNLHINGYFGALNISEMSYFHSLILKLYILTFISWFPLLITKWLQKLVPTCPKVEMWRPFCLCKLDGQKPKISLGNRIYWIQRTWIMLKSLVPSFYPKMPLGALKRALFQKWLQTISPKLKKRKKKCKLYKQHSITCGLIKSI